MWLSLNALDAVTTHLALRLGALEAKTTVGELIGSAGEAATYSLKLLTVLVATALLYKVSWQLLLRPLNVLMVMVIISTLAIVASSMHS
jgi:hypothetical protein